VQIDSTHSVSSLVQRIGRSGRREGEKSIVNLYATDPWSLLQSLACWNLYKKDFLEPLKTAKKPFDILLHQLLSTVKQLSGCSRSELIKRMTINPTFIEITAPQINKLIDESIQKDYLEKIDRELIIGIEGEYIVNSREFYSVFKTEPNFKVIHSGKKIGDIPFSPQIVVDENLLLAARIWKIRDIDFKRSKIIVIPANDGKKPMFFGGGANIHKEIRIEMLRILKSNELYTELDENCEAIISEMRYDFKGFEIKDFNYDCPIIEKEGHLEVYTFSGTKINKSINFLISLTGIKSTYDDQSSLFDITIEKSQLQQLIASINEKYKQLDQYLIEELKGNESLIGFSKWGKYLPLAYQIEIIKERFFDFENAIQLLNNLNFIESK